jgi:hypothetical protein
MEYGSIIWDPYTKQEIKKLESIQRRGARFTTKDYKSSNFFVEIIYGYIIVLSVILKLCC